jgi:hypothetical protein
MLWQLKTSKPFPGRKSDSPEAERRLNREATGQNERITVIPTIVGS